MSNKNTLVYGRGPFEFGVTIGAMDAQGYGHGGYAQTLRVKADNWRAAKRYVERMDPFRIWVDYPALLARCKGEPYVSKVFDRKRSYFQIDEYLPVGGPGIIVGDRYDNYGYEESGDW